LSEFGGNVDHNPDPGFLDWNHDTDIQILKGFLINYCDSYRQPRIQHENPPRKFELAECF